MRILSWIGGGPRKVVTAATVGACLVAGGVVAPLLASASAAVPAPKLTITPSSMYYPCSEGTATFTVKNFPATTQVSLRLGSEKANSFRTFETNARGTGKTTAAFTNYYPGYYTFYATTSTTTAHRLLIIGDCP